MADCIFCKIIAGEIPSKKVYEDDKILVIYDVAPAAPVHVLILPKKHFDNVLSASSEISTYIKEKLPEIVKSLALEEKGFRIVINTGEFGGQTVNHLHVHIIGGKQLGWPPC